jgi:hypothetical protein
MDRNKGIQKSSSMRTSNLNQSHAVQARQSESSANLPQLSGYSDTSSIDAESDHEFGPKVSESKGDRARVVKRNDSRQASTGASQQVPTASSLNEKRSTTDSSSQKITPKACTQKLPTSYGMFARTNIASGKTAPESGVSAGQKRPLTPNAPASTTSSKKKKGPFEVDSSDDDEQQPEKSYVPSPPMLPRKLNLGLLSKLIHDRNSPTPGSSTKTSSPIPSSQRSSPSTQRGPTGNPQSLKKTLVPEKRKPTDARFELGGSTTLAKKVATGPKEAIVGDASKV